LGRFIADETPIAEIATLLLLNIAMFLLSGENTPPIALALDRKFRDPVLDPVYKSPYIAQL
jgi:hypothetical protein